MIILLLLIPLSQVFINSMNYWLSPSINQKDIKVYNIGANLGMIFVLTHHIICFLLYPQIMLLNLGSWLQSSTITVNWCFLFDSLSSMMLIPVVIISGCVQIYSIDYMKDDPKRDLFFTYLSLFTLFMIILVCGANLIVTFLGWEGVGLASFLLINFWHTRIKANKAALKAIIINRIGDFFLLVAIGLIYTYFKTVNYTDLLYLMQYNKFYLLNQSYESIKILRFDILYWSFNYWDVVCFSLLIAAMAKSAQIGLHTWLPDAMEGPTPVSALIHAATMVTAGVFLILRTAMFFQHSSWNCQLMTFIGGLTCLLGATIGVFQHDLKKVIAYSTCSQLGYMFFACGTLNYLGGFFHLFTHAFFKALLFLAAGSIIHTLRDEQNMKKMGSLVRLMPLTYISIFIGSLSLSGFPFLSGFYSKDFILEMAANQYQIHSLVAYWLGTLSVFFTTFYSCRLVYLTFFTSTQIYRSTACQLHAVPKYMQFSLVVLCVLSIVIGYLSSDVFTGVGSLFFADFCPSDLVTNHHFFCERLPFYLKIFPLCCSLLGGACALLFYRYYTYIVQYIVHHNYLYLVLSYIRHIMIFFHKGWLFDKIYNEIIGLTFLSLAKKLYTSVDKGILTYLTSGLLQPFLRIYTAYNARVQTNNLFDYFCWFIVGLIIVLIAGILYV